MSTAGRGIVSGTPSVDSNIGVNAGTGRGLLYSN
jgi:hypothetical protein